MIAYLRNHGMTFQMAMKYQLGFVGRPLPDDEGFVGGLAIPYLTPRGVRSIKFRMMGNGPKCLYHPGQDARLYNTEAYFDAGEEAIIGVTEGEIDAIVATEVIGLPSIGIPGAETWQPHADVWAPAFEDNFQRVIVLADGDSPQCRCTPKCEGPCPKPRRPGYELARQIKEAVGWSVHIIECPRGFDVSSMVAAGRTAELQERIRAIGREE